MIFPMPLAFPSIDSFFFYLFFNMTLIHDQAIMWEGKLIWLGMWCFAWWEGNVMLEIGMVTSMLWFWSIIAIKNSGELQLVLSFFVNGPQPFHEKSILSLPLPPSSSHIFSPLPPPSHPILRSRIVAPSSPRHSCTTLSHLLLACDLHLWGFARVTPLHHYCCHAQHS